MALERIRRHLASHQPVVVEDHGAARAAVTMVLRAAGSDVELLLIQRAERDNDPWSGHMAFPGGRCHPSDPDVLYTAFRETKEEVGINLHADGEVIGRLDEQPAIAHLQPPALVISPIVCVLRSAAQLRLNRREVDSAVWVPLTFFRSAEAKAVYRHPLCGVESEFPAYDYKGYTIWGLTHRILQQFLELVGE